MTSISRESPIASVTAKMAVISFIVTSSSISTSAGSIAVCPERVKAPNGRNTRSIPRFGNEELADKDPASTRSDFRYGLLE